MKTQGPKSENWLSDTMMNLLVDYYPEVPFRPYGSGATRENVLPVLQDLELGYFCIYVKGHGGRTTWPSSLDTQHEKLAQDMPKLFRAVTRETNTRLVLYYSGLLDGVAGERHPQWRMLNPDGTPKECLRNFPFLTVHSLCPLSPYFDEWVSIHLTELIEGYDPDGIWVDGDWPGPCYCPRCQERFRADTGRTESWDELRTQPDFEALYRPTWNRLEHEWRMRFRDFVKSLKPDCIYSAGNVSPRREFLEPFDWRSGDFFSPGFFHLHDMARMMRWYSTLGVPYDAYVCDTSFTHARENVRSRSKTLDRMLQESATVAANGGSVGYWTYPTGHGALVPSRMDKARTVRQFLKEREDVFLHTQSVRWTAVVASDPAAGTLGDSNVAGAHKALSALHRSPDVMDETGITADMTQDLIVLPEQAVLDEPTAARLEDFVRAGGSLLSSGCSIRSDRLRTMLGVKNVEPGALDDGHVLLGTSDEPTGIDSSWDRLELADGEELYPLYLSWDQFNEKRGDLTNNWPMHGQIDEENPEPAGFPAAITRKLGKGRCVHVCTDIFTRYRDLGDPQILRWLREIVDFLQPEPLFTTDAPSWVDVSLRRKDADLIVHFVNHNPGRDVARLGTDDLWVDEIPEVGPYTCEIRYVKKPGAVLAEPGRKTVSHSYCEGVLHIEVPRFKIHRCICVADS